MLYNLDWLFFMPFYEVYLLNYLISYNGTFIAIGSTQIIQIYS